MGTSWPRAVAFSASSVAVVVATGCSLLVDTGSLAGDEPTPDAAKDARVSADGDSPGDGGLVADARVDAEEGGGSAAICPSFAVFCDDFERGDLTKWSMVQTSSNGVATAAGPTSGIQNPWAGAYSLRVFGGMNASVDGGTPPINLANVRANVPPVLSGKVFIRFYVFLPKVLLPGSSLAKLAHQNDTVAKDDISLRIAASDGVNRYRINTDNAVANDSDHDSTATLPIAKWTCLELEIQLASAGHYSLWADGKLVIDAAENTIGTQGVPYDQMRVGFSYSPGAAEQQVFFDDVAYATQKIGCE